MLLIPDRRLMAGLVGAVVLVSACSSPAVAPPTSATATASATAAATTAGAASATATTSPTPTASPTSASSTKKISANTGTSAEIQAALAAAGVPNPANWTREVIEYRPYPAGDANLTKLRQNLVKYNPAPGVVDAIVSALTP